MRELSQHYRIWQFLTKKNSNPHKILAIIYRHKKFHVSNISFNHSQRYKRMRQSGRYVALYRKGTCKDTGSLYPRRKSPLRTSTSSLSRVNDHTTLGKNPLDEVIARHKDFQLTTHNSYKKQTPKPVVGFEPAIPASNRQQTHAFERAATGIGQLNVMSVIIY